MAIIYPYIPEGREIKYVGLDNPWMAAAKEFARENHTVRHIHAIVLVKDGQIIGRGSIGGGYHGEIAEETGAKRGCIRERLNVPTGTHYDLCPGCGYEFHSEPSSIRDAKASGADVQGADIYFWGHWWCCEPCWKVMIAEGIRDVYLLEDSEKLFNKSHPDNIVGRQFD